MKNKTLVENKIKEEQYKKLAKYLKGSAKALSVLADEIVEAGEFDNESKELLSKIGANLLFEARAYDYKK